MGTNYYLHEHTCASCGSAKKVRHIGKSSSGWCFALHVYPEEGINTLADWCDYIFDHRDGIVDEYDTKLTYHDLMKIMCGRYRLISRTSGSNWESDDGNFIEIMGAMRGPNNLLRNRIDGVHCVGHNADTIDYIVGDFS